MWLGERKSSIASFVSFGQEMFVKVPTSGRGICLDAGGCFRRRRSYTNAIRTAGAMHDGRLRSAPILPLGEILIYS